MKTLISALLGMVLAVSFTLSLNYLILYTQPQILTSEIPYRFDDRKVPEMLAHAPSSRLKMTEPSLNGTDMKSSEAMNVVAYVTPSLLIVYSTPLFIALLTGLFVYFIVKKFVM